MKLCIRYSTIETKKQPVLNITFFLTATVFSRVRMRKINPLYQILATSFVPIVMYLTCTIMMYRVMTSARSCNKVCHLFWFTILTPHETNDVIMYIHSVHKHRGNSFQRQNYKMRLKQRSLNWTNSMQVKKILFINVFFPDHYAC